MRLVIGIIFRILFILALLYIIFDACYVSFINKEWLWFVGKIVLFPVTYFVWPWVSHNVFAIIAFFIALVSYPISTFIGRLKPID
jgi:hypothetical protein